MEVTMESENSNYLKRYISLVEFMANLLPKNCEIVLHDISDVNKSIIAIKNNEISNRDTGGCLTDFGLMLLKQKVYEKNDYIINYSSKTNDGKMFCSSTYFIKDDSGILRGMLCVNVDLTIYFDIKKSFNNYFNFLDIKPEKNFVENNNNKNNVNNVNDVMEHLDGPIATIVSNIIQNSLIKLNVPSPERLSIGERSEIIRILNEKGVFLIKGAVAEVAKQLKVSENTIYRYINKLE